MELKDKLKIYRLSEDEFAKIQEILGRDPEGVEWALFSALWSEHCSYKSSKKHLKKFYSQNERVLQSFGENAGVIDLGQGERVAFKMESHNHPSFISPVQGAATGVGGILRDIFTMGARPIALANYLCFGDPKADKMPHLVDGVVEGISSYGNCVGVPMVTGQTEFDKSYNGNILVNALALGLFRPGENVFTSGTAEPGQYVVYVGAKTGKDGVHGASMASESFDDTDGESKKPTVQIGDPFFEKLLIESCLEVMEKNLVESIQDMGAAGLTSSAFEMASKAGVGFEMHLDKVPARDLDITPEEILLSESQERMLLTCRPEKFKELENIFVKWDLDAAVVGKVHPQKSVELYWKGKNICSMEPDVLVENAPLYDREYRPWKAINRVESTKDLIVSKNTEPTGILLASLTDVRGGQRNWIYEQYDQRVGAKTHRDCSNTIGVVRLPDSQRALGLVLGCRPYVMRLDTAEGGKDAVIYPALQLACKGFKPLALTDCLNFGNPEKPELMTEFVAAVENMSAACEAFDTPVISGNVSLYNETGEKNVTSTPSTGVVGIREAMGHIPDDRFQKKGSHIYLLKSHQLVANGQCAEIQGLPLKAVGEIRVSESAAFSKQLESICSNRGVLSSRVVGKLGLAGTLAKMSMGQLGAEIHLGDRIEEFGSENSALFAEAFYEVIVEVSSGCDGKGVPEFQGVEAILLGTVAEEHLKIGEGFLLSLNEISKTYSSSWEKQFETLA